MKFISCLLLIVLPFFSVLKGQHLNADFDIYFNVNEDSVELADEFDIEGEVTNITSNTLNGDIHLDIFIGTSIPAQFYNNPTLSEIISVSRPILPGDDIDFEFEEIEVDDPMYNFQSNKQNIIIIWPKLGPGESADSLNFYVDTLFVLPDTSGSVSIENIKNIEPLKVYPNPITGNQLNIDLSELPLEPYYLTLWNHLGQQLKSNIVLQGGQMNQVATRGVGTGIVLAQLSDENGKLIKQKRIVLQSSIP